MLVMAISRSEEVMYKGEIAHVRDDGEKATIKRVDKKLGSGVDIPGYGRGWIITKRFGHWADESKNIVLDKIDNWKSFIGASK